MHTRHTRSAATLRRLACAAFFSLFTLCSSLFSQAVPQPAISGTVAITSGTAAAVPVVTTTGTAAGGDEVVQMSVFNVNSGADQGYTAANTASGSRINTPLRDTAASISPFTQEFLQDIGATTVEDMLSYGSNIEGVGVDDLTGGFNPDSMAGTTTDTNFRVRGMTANTAVNGVTTSYSQDTYNIDRAEVSSGPNSILFGMGEPGGMVALTTKRANLQRNTLSVTNVIGTWTSPAVSGIPYYRATANYNIVFMPRILALRLMGVYQDGATGTNGSWRYAIKSRDKRFNPVVTFKPFQDTTINISYETGRTRSNPSLPWNADDHVTLWFDYNRPIQSSFGGGVLPGTGAITAPFYTFVDNNKTLFNTSGALWSLSNIPPGTNSQQARLDPSISSYYYNPVGPSGLRDQKFDSYQFVIEQRFGPVNLQLGYYHNTNHATLHGGAAGYGMPLYGDPNKYLSTPEYQGTSGASTVLNDYAGNLYMQDNWQYRDVMNRNDSLRLTTEYSVNLQKWGRHRLIANLEDTNTESRALRALEIFVDTHQIPLSTVANPTAAANQVIRRNYVTEGDFTTYHPGAWNIPIDPFMLSGNVYHTQYASVANPTVAYHVLGYDADGNKITVYPYGMNVFQNGTSNALNHLKNRSYAASLTLQSYWFKDRLVTLLGGRVDDLTRKAEMLSRVIDSADPRILDGSKVLNEAVYSGYWREKPHARPYTYTAGAVWHATDRLSVFANYSNNTAVDAVDNTVLSPSGNPPVARGTTKDYGVMYNILSDGSLSLRLTSFDTNQKNQIAASGNNQIGYTSTVIQNIYKALLATNLISQAEFNAQPQTYSASLSDVSSQGYEAEITGMFAKSITLRFTLSYTARQRENTFKEIFSYFNANIPIWMNLADPARNASGEDIPYVNGGSTNLYDYFLDQLYGSNGFANNFRDSISNVLRQQSGGMASRPVKFNFTGKYSFRDGWLKGAALGGAVRFSSYSLQPNPLGETASYDQVTRDDHPDGIMMDPTIYYNYTNMSRSPGLLFYDAFASYRCKLFGGRTTMTLQLNVKNLFNQDVVVSARISQNNAGVLYLRRVYLNEPRSIRLTATFDF